MQQRFQKQEKEVVKNEFGDCPLYKVINSTCRGNFIAIQDFLPCSEEVFYEVLRILDNLKENPQSYAEEEIPQLWASLLSEYRNINKEYNIDDHQKMASLVYACAWSVIDCSNINYYGITIKNAMQKAAVREKNNHLMDIMLPMAESLNSKAMELRAWIDSYMCSDTFLSDEIDKAIKPKRKQKKNKKIIPHTLRYTKVDKETKKNRLQIIMRLWVDWGWIEEPNDADCFYDFFEGDPKYCNLKWRGTPKAVLTELMKRLLEHPNIEPDDVGCSSKSIVEKQFGEYPSDDRSRLSQTDKDNIDLVLYLIDPKSKLPTLDEINEDNSLIEATLQEVYKRNLHIVKNIK